MFTQAVKNIKTKLSFLLYFTLTIGLLTVVTGCGEVVSTAGLDQPIPEGTIFLAWDSPTQNIDGTPINNELAGYRVYYGTQSGVYTSVHTINEPDIRTCVIAADINEELFFVLTAMNIYGNESEYSLQISKVAM